MTGYDTLKLASNLTFTGTTFNFYTISRLDLNGYEMKINGSFLNGTVEGNGGSLWFSGNSSTHSTHYYGPLNIKGTCQLTGGGVYFYDEIFVMDTLVSNASWGTEVIVNGPLFNYGHIIDGTSSLQVILNDAFINEGEASCYLLRFSGTSPQLLATYLPIEAYSILQQNSSGIIVDSELLLSGGTFSGNNYPVFLSEYGMQADEMSIINTYFYNDAIVPINLMNGGYVQSCRFYGDVQLEGTLIIYGDGTQFYGTLWNQGTITRYPSYYSFEVEFKGPVINSGLITNAGLFVKAFDDVHNSGTWNNYQLTLAGSGEQKLKTDSAIQIQNVYSNDTTGYINADGNLSFEGSNISLSHEEIYLNGNRIQLSGGSISNAVFKAGGGKIRLIDEAYISQTKFYEDIYLEGTFQVYGDGCEFYGRTFVSDTLTKIASYYAYTVFFYNQLINNGLITSGNLYINAYEDILNNGIWNNYQINMASSGEQSIITNTPISTSSFYSTDTTGSLLAGGNLQFNNCTVNLNEEQLYLAGNELILVNSTIQNSKVIAQDGSMRMNGESYMSNCDFFTGIELFGKVRNVGNDNHFYGPVLVKDTLDKVPSYYSETMYFHAPLNNQGAVLGSNLYIESYSDLTNEGIWKNYQTLLKGTVDQNIQLINDAEITSQLLFYAMVPGATSYIWYKNGQSMVGQGSTQFTNLQSNYMYSTDTIDASYAGTYYCSTNSGQSRLISIQNAYQQLSVDLGSGLEICESDSVLLSPVVSFGTSPYTYAWSNGASSTSIYAVAGSAAAFSVTVTDALSQFASDTVFVTSLPLPLIDLPQDTFACEALMIFLPYFDATFLWSTGQVMNHIIIDSAGLYSVTVTSSQNCVASDEIFVEIFTAPVINLGPDQVLGVGSVAVLDAGSGMTSYLWSTSATTQSISVDVSGTYWVSVTAPGNCTTYDEVVITVESLPAIGESCLSPYLYGTVNDPSVTGETEAAYDSDWWSFTIDSTEYMVVVSLCGSSYDTKIEVFDSCGANYLAYNDDQCNLSSEVYFDTLEAGTYFVRVYGYTYNFGAYILDIHSFQCGSLDLNGGAFAQNCGYIELGQAEVYADAGVYPYEYNWSNGGIDHFIFDSAGVYTVTVTDAMGCTDTKTFVIPLSHVLDLDLGPDQTVYQGATIELAALSNMEMYYWSTTDTTQSILVIQSGTYAVEVMDTLGCFASDQVLISFNTAPNPIDIYLAPDDTICIGDEVLLSATISGGNAPFSFLWSNGETTDYLWVSPQTTTSYSLTVTSGSGLYDSDEITINVAAAPVVEIMGESTGCELIELFVPIYDGNFLWSTGETTNFIYADTTDYYSITVTSPQNCTAMDEVFVQIYSAPVVNLGPDQILVGGNTLVLDAGSGMTSYLWSTGESTQTISIAASGTYWVSVSAPGNCTAYDEIVVSNASVPTIGESCLNPYYYGTVNDSAVTGETEAAFDSDWWSFTVDSTAYQVVVSLCGSAYDTKLAVYDSCGGNYLAFNDDQCSLASEVYLDSLVAGTYFVQVFGYMGYYGAYSLDIHSFQCGSLDLNGGAFAQNCGYIELGQAEVYADAGVYPYEYNWSNGGIDHFIFDSAGVYTVTVTDAMGCTDTKTFVIPLSHVLDLDLGPDQTVYQGSTVELTALPNMELYYWSTTDTTQSILVTQTGTYLVDIMDTLGCYASDQIFISFSSAPNPIDVYLAPDDTICVGDEVLLSATIIGGNAPFSFLWSNGETTDYLWVSPQTTTSYSLTVTSGSGLLDSDEITLFVAAAPVVNIIGEATACEGMIKMLQVNSPGTYIWSTGASTAQIFVNTSGVYAVTVSSSSGCTASDEHSINFIAAPVVDLGADQTACAGDVVTLEAYGGQSYYWSNGSQNSWLNVTLGGTYSVSVTNSYGCTGTDQVNVTFNPLPSVSIGPDLSILEGSSVVLSPGSGFATYLWSTGSTESSIEVSLAATYSVEVSDANGCFNSDEMVLSTYQINPSPGWTFANTGIMHTILIPDTCLITMDGLPIGSGDYIGVFYTDNGTLECGGYVVWNGQVTALTAWGDDAVTPEKDGFEEGEDFTFVIWSSATGILWDPQPQYMPLTVMPNQGEFAVNGLSGLLSLVATSIDYQYINLPVNWSYFSTYIDLLEPNIADLMAPILPSVIIAKNSAGQSFWPQYSLNMIGNLVLGKGYQAKMSAAAVLECTGDAVVPENFPISLPASWSILGYLRQNQASISALLAPIVSDLIICKDSWGNTYWPQWNLNNIGNMKPGEGYLIKMASPAVYTYPGNNQFLKLESYSIIYPTYFKHTLNSDGQMTVCIPDFAWLQSPDYGDEIAALDAKGRVVGSAVYQGGSIGLTIWQEDDMEHQSIGMISGERYQLVLWKSSENQVYKLKNMIYLEGTDVYETNATAVIAEVGIEQHQRALLAPLLFPNPASERVMLTYELPEGGWLNLYNQLGELILTQEIDAESSEMEFAVKNFPAGLYWIRVMNAQQSYTLPLEIVH
jgi:hypothetical protein